MSQDEIAGARPKGMLAGNLGSTGVATTDVSWHSLDIAGTLAALGSRSGGLSSAEAAERLTVHGPNELQAARRISPWSILFEQFKNVLIVILLVATALSAFLGHGIEALAITVIVLFAVILGFVQEYRAERAIEALRSMAAPRASVLRDGEETEVPARDVVPGDVVMLRAGNRVPGDARLLAWPRSLFARKPGA